MNRGRFVTQLMLVIAWRRSSAPFSSVSCERGLRLRRCRRCSGFSRLSSICRASSAESAGSTVVKLAGFQWTRSDFCRGWLITGDTGSGKTRSGITPLLFQIFQNEPTWGGLCIDDKGLYWETLSEMARHFGREDDLILLQVRPDDQSPATLAPRHTYNLTSDRSIPYNTFAKAVVDTASSLGQAGDKGFFKNQAQIHIAAALETLREIGADVTLENAYHLLLDQGDLDEAMTDLLRVIKQPAAASCPSISRIAFSRSRRSKSAA